MDYWQSVLRARRYGFLWVPMLAGMLLVASNGKAQNKATTKEPEASLREELNKYPGLPEELGRLFQKLMLGVKLPAARTESQLLPLLPASTIGYAAIPNYGDAVSQTLNIFQEEKKQSQALRDWLSHGEMASSGPKIEEVLDKIVRVHQYLGDEIVVSVAMDSKEPTFVILSEVRKPGLKQFLQQTIDNPSGKSKSGLRVLDAKELATAREKAPGEDLIVVVRPDFVIAGESLAGIRTMNTKLDGHNGEFATTAFGQRMGQEYQGGVTVLVGADIHKILERSSPELKNSAPFQHSGFAETQYLVWDHKTIAGAPLSEMELSFNAPRHGASAWLGKPTPLGSLNFVSPKAIMVGTLVLANPGQILDDAKELARLANANTFAAVTQAEQAMKLSLKDDFLSMLSGEITVEAEPKSSPQSTWKTILAVKDVDHLQQTLDTLVAQLSLEAGQVEDGGVTYHTLQVPSGKSATEVAYAFLDGYMVVGSSRDAVAEAVQLHRAGGSLGRSNKFLAALPPGHALEASALFYHDPITMTASRLRALMPELEDSLEQYASHATPSVICLFGEESAIREISTNSAFDVGGVLIVAAVAIPNLLRSKVAANEASAVGSVRTINTAQVMYAATYPNRGFAQNLASLGNDPKGPENYSTEHAGMIDGSLANESCRAEGWCTKSGYLFQVKTTCKAKNCSEYVIIATPVSASTGTRSFCSTSDGVLRFHTEDHPLSEAPSAAECKGWQAIQ
jgi:type II secretory pathway pseudopilin PulG